jgi:hypothetical protein
MIRVTKVLIWESKKWLTARLLESGVSVYSISYRMFQRKFIVTDSKFNKLTYFISDFYNLERGFHWDR